MRMEYNSLIVNGRKIQDCGNTIYYKLNEVYDKLNKKKWVGNQQNEIGTLFNNMAPQMEGIINYLTYDIPEGFNTVIGNYARVDEDEEVRRIEPIMAQKLNQIKLSDVGEVIDFDNGQITDLKDTANQNFEIIKQTMSDVKVLVQNLEWEGEAKETWVSEIKKDESTINSNLDELKNYIVNFFAEFVQSGIAAEQANSKN